MNRLTPGEKEANRKFRMESDPTYFERRLAKDRRKYKPIVIGTPEFEAEARDRTPKATKQHPQG